MINICRSIENLLIHDEILFYRKQKTQEMYRKVGLYIYGTFLKVGAPLEVFLKILIIINYEKGEYK